MNFKFLFFCTFVVLLLGVDSAESSEETSDDRAGKSRNRRSTESSSYFFYQEGQYPRDCQEVYEQCNDQTESGVFMIQPDDAPEPFNVYCNNSIDGGGWTVFQRRIDGAVDFYRDWNDYKDGFGFLQREFWLGNDKLSYVTNQGNYELRIDLVSRNGTHHFAKYDLFRISDEASEYRLTDLGAYLPESTANNDAMAGSRNISFSTFDRDNDRDESANCSSALHGAWWFHCCTLDIFVDCWDRLSNLNGLYFDGQDSVKSIFWSNLPGDSANVVYTEMKLRRF